MLYQSAGSAANAFFVKKRGELVGSAPPGGVPRSGFSFGQSSAFGSLPGYTKKVHCLNCDCWQYYLATVKTRILPEGIDDITKHSVFIPFQAKLPSPGVLC